MFRVLVSTLLEILAPPDVDHLAAKLLIEFQPFLRF